MLIVWVLTGFWHGASYNYILWGLYYFFFLMLEKIYIGKRLSRTSSVIKHIYTLLVVVIGWAFFYFEDLANLKKLFQSDFLPKRIFYAYRKNSRSKLYSGNNHRNNSIASDCKSYKTVCAEHFRKQIG